jgi:hypothetical protein
LIQQLASAAGKLEPQVEHKGLGASGKRQVSLKVSPENAGESFAAFFK